MSNLPLAYVVPLLLVICANVAYHFAAKSTPPTLNPFLSLSVTYGIALLFSLILFALTATNSIAMELGKLKWSSLLMGLAVLSVEFGWIWIYRNGWEISKASIIANIGVSIVLLVIGIMLFNEGISLKKMAGLLVCLVGVFLINAN